MRWRVVSAFFLLIALSSPGFAADRQAEGRPSLDRILPEIRRQAPGAFYDAEGPFITPDGQARYRIKWMAPDGRIIWFDADARNGRLLVPVPNPGGNRFGGDRYDGRRYDENRNKGDDRRNSNHFGDDDRGQYSRGGRDRDGRGGNDGNWDRGGFGHGYPGHRGSGHGHRD